MSEMLCARPACEEKENRINGYCSVYCEDVGELQKENAALKRENADTDFLLAKAYDLLEKASGKKDEFGAEAQIWCMQYEDALLEDQDA